MMLDKAVSINCISTDTIGLIKYYIEMPLNKKSIKIRKYPAAYNWGWDKLVNHMCLFIFLHFLVVSVFAIQD